MSKEFRWGIISTGGIATSFARDLGFFNDHIVAAVGSRNITSAQRFADEFLGCTPYGSYEELVADPTIDDRLREEKQCHGDGGNVGSLCSSHD